MSARRRALVWTLIVAASVIAVASVLTLWVHRQMLDEDSWKEASAELIEDPAVRSALSVYLVDQLYDNVDVAADLEQRLPEELKPLAGPVAGALRQPATDAVNRLLDTAAVQQLWVEASALAQQKLVNVLEDKTGHGISTGDGEVTLDLGDLVTQLGTELGLSSSVLDRIPPDAGVITVMRSDQLATAQTVVKVLKALSVALLVLVLALYALAVYLATGERRRTLRNVGWALVLVGIVVLVARRLTGEYAVNALTSPQSQDAGRRAWLIGSEILGQIGVAAILYGAVVVAGTILAGPAGWATTSRRHLASLLDDRAGIAWGVVAGAYLLLVLWGPTHALRTAWGILLLGALLAAAVAALFRQTATEFAAAQVTQAAPAVDPGGGNGEAAPPGSGPSTAELPH
jgi:hypothetical protein